MLNGNKIIVVMPAYNAVRTLRQTQAEVPREIVDEVLLVDDYSGDSTIALARELGLTTFLHKRNLGYGRNQKTCYREALKRGAGIVGINFRRSVTYGMGVPATGLKFRQQRMGLGQQRIFQATGRTLVDNSYEEIPLRPEELSPAPTVVVGADAATDSV